VVAVALLCLVSVVVVLVGVVVVLVGICATTAEGASSRASSSRRRWRGRASAAARCGVEMPKEVPNSTMVRALVLRASR
jgi:hypothetical protein